MWKGAAARLRWEAVRASQVERECVAEEAAAAGASFMGRIWYRMRVRKEQRQKEARRDWMRKRLAVDAGSIT